MNRKQSIQDIRRNGGSGIIRWIPIVFIILALTVSFVPFMSNPRLNSSPFGAPQLSDPYVRSTTDDRLVFTYYFYWYDWNTSFHFSSVECADWNAYHPVNPEEVSYLNADWHYRELKDMIMAGVDVVLPVYDGNPMLRGHPSEEWAWQGLPPLIEALDQLETEDYNSENGRNATNPIPKVGMFLDTSYLEHGFSEEELDSADPMNNQTLWDYFYDGIADFFSYFDPKYLQQVEHADDSSQPTAYIVWLWFQNKMSRFSQHTLDYVEARFLDEFNHSLIFVGTGDRTWRTSWMGNAPEIDGAYQWMPYEKGYGIREYSPIRIGTAIAGVNFGNETNGSVCVDGRKPRYAPHDPGKYRASLQALLEKDCNWIALDTWNEFHEGTQMCRTIEHGDTFIKIAGEWSERFHTEPPASPIKLFFMEQPAIFIIIGGLGVLGWAAWSWWPKKRDKLHS
ncbi:hypothetical protein GF325_03885 [Candidatus Bathyarchaeota archaeon]|nr:hypothetical protein [Candidatus Bathyarchaeota archaeon]